MKWWRTYRELARMRRRLSWSMAEIRRYRLERLRQIVSFAYTHSPFYRQFYEAAGIRPQELQAEADLTRLPLLEKRHLQEVDPLQIVTQRGETGNPEPVAWVIESTSGSTGKPLKVYRTWNDLYAYKAREIRSFQQTGLRFYHRQVILKSSAESVTGQHWFEHWGILRKYWLSIRDPVELNLQRLREIRPNHVHAYPSGLLDIAGYLDAQGEVFPIPIICTGAEVLDEISRQVIGRAFQAEVFDLYGTREVGNIAWECRAHQGLHINDDMLILELLDENGREVPDGVEGEVVVTYLEGYDFPFIRYRLGDRAMRLPGKCPCGVRFSRLGRVSGRSDSRVRLPSGEWLTGMVFQELRATPWVSVLRIIQDDRLSLRLQIVPKAEPDPVAIKALTEKTSLLVRNELKVVPEVLPELKGDASGKLRMVVCRLSEAEGHLP